MKLISFSKSGYIFVLDIAITGFPIGFFLQHTMKIV